MKYQTGCVYFLIKNKTFKQLILHVSTEINGFILISKLTYLPERGNEKEWYICTPSDVYTFFSYLNVWKERLGKSK